MKMDVTTAVLDRWEGDFGVLEELGPVPRLLLPRAAREGDVIRVESSRSSVVLTLDIEARGRREEELSDLRDRLVKVNPPDGDIFEL